MGYGLGDRLLPGELGAAVLGARGDRVGLDVRRALLAVEHVVGRDVHDPRPGGRGRSGDVTGAIGVDSAREPALLLRPVHVGERRAVDHAVGNGGADGGDRRVAIGDVELRSAEGNDVMAGGGRRLGGIAAEHAGGSGNQYPHAFQG